MEENSFEAKAQMLYVNLRKELKGVRKRMDKYDALALVMDMIDVSYDLCAVSCPSRRHILRMIVIVESYLTDGQDMGLAGTEVRKDIRDKAMEICNNLYDELNDGKL